MGQESAHIEPDVVSLQLSYVEVRPDRWGAAR